MTPGYLVKKLDRFLVNDVWMDEFPDLKVTFLPPDFSDHCACLLSSFILLKKPGSFKFFNYRIKHKEFTSTIFQHWAASKYYGTICTSSASFFSLSKLL